jgi:hypothetical protein
MTGGNLNCGTDGGLKNNRGTFGLVVSIEEKIVWEGCGPVDGNPDTESSKRSELFGYAGLLEFLLMLDRLILPQEVISPITQVRTCIDNSSVVTQLRAFLLGHQPKRAYPHNADIISHIRSLWTQLPRFNHKVFWVKAHQDDEYSFHLLDLPAQLNVCAEAMATEYSDNAKHSSKSPSSQQPAFFPSANVSLLINLLRLTSQYTESIRFHIHGTTHCDHLQKSRKAWKLDSVWNNIDMQGLGITFNSLDTPSQHFTSKMLHGWLNTGRTSTRQNNKGPTFRPLPLLSSPKQNLQTYSTLHCSDSRTDLQRSSKDDC